VSEISDAIDARRRVRLRELSRRLEDLLDDLEAVLTTGYAIVVEAERDRSWWAIEHAGSPDGMLDDDSLSDQWERLSGVRDFEDVVYGRLSDRTASSYRARAIARLVGVPGDD
jgi:hypothetical protein